MRLYQHVARCPVALRAFLDCNPEYWCFIPRPCNERMLDNFTSLGEPREYDQETRDSMKRDDNHSQRVTNYLERIRIPPAGFTFSYLDRRQQHSFFKHMMTKMVGQLLYKSLDIHKYSMIAVCMY